MFRVISPQQARDCIASAFAGVTMASESVALACAHNRVLAHDLCADADIPQFDRSTVDGYAVRAADTFGATDAMPAMLRLTSEVLMGQASPRPLAAGECAALPTGGALPQGADAAVMLEHTEDLSDGFIYIQKSVAPGANVIFRGDDARAGDALLSRGKRLSAFDVGVLAACGHAQVAVSRLPRVGIISTGDEIAAQGSELGSGRVYDVNAPALHAALQGYGEPVCYGIVPDELDALLQTVRDAAAQCDAVLVTGGSSVGARDNAHKAFAALGAKALFHGLALKPGKPTMLYDLGGKPLFGLPGHPVAALMVFLTLVRPLLSSMMGEAEVFVPPVRAMLALNCPSNHGREEYVPVRLTQEGDGLTAHPITGKSGLITMLSSAAGFFVIPRESEGFSQGRAVDVQLFTRAVL